MKKVIGLILIGILGINLHAYSYGYYDNQALAQKMEERCKANDRNNNSDVDACAYIGNFYRQGIGVTRDREQAFKLLSWACRHQSDEGCHYLGGWYEEENKPEDADKSYRQACANGYADACYDNGVMYHKFYKQMPEKEGRLENTLYFYYQACAYKKEEGCDKVLDLYNTNTVVKTWATQEKYQYIADLLCQKGVTRMCEQMVENSENNASSLIPTYLGMIESNQNACEKEYKGDNCFMLTKAYKELGKIYFDPKNKEHRYTIESKYEKIDESLFDAKDNFKKLCENGHMEACNEVGKMYEEGLGAIQDFDMAKSYYAKACEGRVQEGCSNYKAVNSMGKRSYRSENREKKFR
jgi:TPR repeat protein